MKKLTVLLVSISLLLLVGCGKKSPLVGTWKGDSNDGLNTTFVFKKNGDVEYKNEFGIESKGTYKINKDEVTIKIESWDKAKVYKFKVKDSKLSLSATDKYSPSYKNMIKKD